MTNAIKISVVIPHYNGLGILRDCLESLYKNTFREFETILIDNGSTDGSQDFVEASFPQVRLVRNVRNRGYAGGCNQGIELASAALILLLNNDTVMPPDLLQVLYETINTGDDIAAVQPKIVSIQDPSRFDYSGGAGGELDVFGYPFARGRIFDAVEKDEKQYDTLSQVVFWTSGCALLLRKRIVDEIGGLDEDFFAHQEEIDFNWRAQLAGYRNFVTTRTYIYHHSGYTLRSDNARKMYLNHRNNLLMMIKNYSLSRLLLLLPLRLLMELITMPVDVLLWDGKRAGAAGKALWFLLRNPGILVRKHRQVQRVRRVGDRIIMRNMYHGSIVWQHFVNKKSAWDCVKKYRKQVD